MVRMVARLPSRLTRKRSDMRPTISRDTTLQEAGSEHSESRVRTKILLECDSPLSEENTIRL